MKLKLKNRDFLKSVVKGYSNGHTIYQQVSYNEDFDMCSCCMFEGNCKQFENKHGGISCELALNLTWNCDYKEGAETRLVPMTGYQLALIADVLKWSIYETLSCDNTETEDLLGYVRMLLEGKND